VAGQPLPVVVAQLGERCGCGSWQMSLLVAALSTLALAHPS